LYLIVKELCKFSLSKRSFLVPLRILQIKQFFLGHTVGGLGRFRVFLILTISLQ
jgi:hypothetical protein